MHAISWLSLALWRGRSRMPIPIKLMVPTNRFMEAPERTMNSLEANRRIGDLTCDDLAQECRASDSYRASPS
eukprot:3234622-Pyramimonas_sp.AAC.1